LSTRLVVESESSESKVAICRDRERVTLSGHRPLERHFGDADIIVGDNSPSQLKQWFSALGLQLKADPIIHGLVDALLAAKVALGGLD
jgi:hypothetical protein